MARTSHRTGRRPLAGLALLAALAAVSAIASTNTDLLVARGFSAALTRAPGLVSAPPLATASPVSGSEDFWLRQAVAQPSLESGISLASWSAPVSLGARLTLTVAGREQSLEVTEISDLPQAATHLNSTGKSKRLVMVSCQEPGKPGAVVLRLIVEADPAAAPRDGAQQQARAL
jgi:hypothetical protein